MLLWRFSSSGLTHFLGIQLGRICTIFNFNFLLLNLEDKDPASGEGYLLWNSSKGYFHIFVIVVTSSFWNAVF